MPNSSSSTTNTGRCNGEEEHDVYAPTQTDQTESDTSDLLDVVRERASGNMGEKEIMEIAKKMTSSELERESNFEESTVKPNEGTCRPCPNQDQGAEADSSLMDNENEESIQELEEFDILEVVEKRASAAASAVERRQISMEVLEILDDPATNDFLSSKNPKGPPPTKSTNKSSYPDVESGDLNVHVLQYVLPEQAENTDEIHTSPESPTTDSEAAAPIPRLVRQQPVTRATAAQPGAYSGSAGGDLQRRDNISFSLVGAGSDDDLSQPTNDDAPTTTITTGGGQGLAQAKLVEDGTAAHTEAQPFDSDAAAKRKSQHWKGQRLRLLAMTTFITVVGATVIALVLANKRKEEDSSSNLSLAPSEAPSTSMSPSNIPSLAPTGALDLLLLDLPNSTLQNFKNISTPQWGAYDWLTRHPDLPGMPEWRKKQLFALACFYYAMEGPKWPQEFGNEWLQYDKPECYWFSVTADGFFDEDGKRDTSYVGFFKNNTASCNNQDEFVVLHFMNLGLTEHDKPFVPPEIALLTSLFDFQIGSCGIHTGMDDLLPPEFFTLTNLMEINLGFNPLTGSLPSELGLLTKLTKLGFAGDGLSGAIPSEFGLLTNLKYWFHIVSGLSGPIPSELGQMTSITELSLAVNRLTATIPSEIGLMTKLQRQFGLSNNALTGSLPSQFGLTSSLKSLALGSNSLTGTIPSELFMLSNIEQLQLDTNALTGTIASEVGLLTNLAILNLHGNAITGKLPTEMGLLTNLKLGLSLFSNDLRGTIPTEMGSLRNVTKLYLNSNKLSGSLPSELRLLTNMVELSLQLNALSGFIPSQLALLTGLGKVELQNNSLTGVIPLQLGHLVPNGSLSVLTLEGNELSGEVPEDLCLLGLYNSSPPSLHPLLGFYLPGEGPGLSFDCNDQLCGCDWCICNGQV